MKRAVFEIGVSKWKEKFMNVNVTTSRNEELYGALRYSLTASTLL